ncbi:MAG: PAS domain-containing protein [Actinomycetota bacterium]
MSSKATEPPASGNNAPAPELFKELLDRAQMVTYAVRMDTGERTLVYMSPNCSDVLGLTPEEFMEQSLEERLERIHPSDRDVLLAGARGTAAPSGAFDSRYRYLHPDGRVLHLSTLSRVVSETPGEPPLRLGLIMDVTAETATSQALRDSEARFRALVERVPAVVYIDSNEPVPSAIYVSPEITTLFGFEPQEWTRDPDLWLQSIHPEDRADVMGSWAASVDSGCDFHREYRSIHRDGHVLWVRDGATLIRDEDGAGLFWQGVIQDITDRKDVEESLRESESRYRTLIEQAPAIVYEMGPDDERRTLFVSPHVEDILGYSRQEWLDQPDIWIELLHPEDRERELEAHDRHTQTGEPWVRTYRLIAADGRTVWVRDQAVLVREPHRPNSSGTWHGVMLDITAQKSTEEDLHLANELLEYRVRERTVELEEANELMSLEIAERQRAEGELQQANERNRTLVEQIPAVIYRSTVLEDSSSAADYTSPQIERVLGYTPAEWIPLDFWIERLHPHDRDRVLDAWAISKRSGQPFSEEFRFLAKDGRIVWVLDQTALLSRDPVGRPQRFQGVMLDITARKEAEAAAVDAEARYQALASQGPVMAYLWERDPNGGGRRPYISPQVERLLGYPVELWNTEAEFFLSIIHPDDLERVNAWEIQAGYTGEAWSLDYRVISRAGEIVWLHDEGSLLSRDDAGRPHRFHGVYIDITDRKAIEQDLREAEERYRSLVEQLPAVPWTEEINLATGRSTLTYLGPQTESVLGWSAEEIAGDRWDHDRILHPDDREEATRASRIAVDGGDWDQTYRIVARDGSIRRVRSVGRCVSEPGAPTQIWQGITIAVAPKSKRIAPQADAGLNPSV